MNEPGGRYTPDDPLPFGKGFWVSLEDYRTLETLKDATIARLLLAVARNSSGPDRPRSRSGGGRDEWLSNGECRDGSRLTVAETHVDEKTTNQTPASRPPEEVPPAPITKEQARWLAVHTFHTHSIADHAPPCLLCAAIDSYPGMLDEIATLRTQLAEATKRAAEAEKALRSIVAGRWSLSAMRRIAERALAAPERGEQGGEGEG